MANPASALGEAIGHLIESQVQKIVREAVKKLDCYVDTGGKRLDKRKGTKLLLVNDTGNEYQIDTVVEDKHKNPIALIECKYIRYKKHNRDKASWTCVAHYKLRTTYPTVRKSIAVLIGDWTAPSKKLMRSFGIEIIEIPFDRLATVLLKHGVNFRWAEKDTMIPTSSLITFRALSNEMKEEIAVECMALARKPLKKLVRKAITSKEVVPRNVDQIELLLKTNRDEFVLKKFLDLTKAISYMVSLTGQKSDVGNILAPTPQRALKAAEPAKDYSVGTKEKSRKRK
jgi:hypothetical protein